MAARSDGYHIRPRLLALGCVKIGSGHVAHLMFHREIETQCTTRSAQAVHEITCDAGAEQIRVRWRGGQRRGRGCVAAQRQRGMVLAAGDASTYIDSPLYQVKQIHERRHQVQTHRDHTHCQAIQEPRIVGRRAI